MPKIKERRLTLGMSGSQLAQYLGKDKRDISKIENYYFLPTKYDLENMLKVLNCDVLELYDKNELPIEIIQKINGVENNIKKYNVATVKTCVATKNKGNSRVDTYNFCVRVHRSEFPLLTKNTLSECGYNSLREFLCQAYEVLQKRYEKIKIEASSLNDEKPQSA